MDIALLEALGSNIRALRRLRHWSQEELAERCGLHRTYIGGVERGERNISVVNLARIAGAMEVPIQHLFAPPSEPRP